MKKAVRITLSVVFILAIAILPMAAAAIPVPAHTFSFPATKGVVPDLYFTGVCGDPPGTNQRLAFVEVYNASDKPIDLLQYKLAYQHTSVNVNQNNPDHVLFNPIAKYAQMDATAEPATAVLAPGEVGLIWVQGTSDATATGWTTSQFLADWGLDDATITKKLPSTFVSRHDAVGWSTTNNPPNGSNFYIMNTGADHMWSIYLVDKNATTDNWKNSMVCALVISGADIQAGSFPNGDKSIQKLRYDPEIGFSTLNENVASELATGAERKFEVGAKLFHIEPSLKLKATSASTAETTAPPVVTAPPTTGGGTTTTPQTSDPSIIIGGAALAMSGITALLIKKNKK